MQLNFIATGIKSTRKQPEGRAKDCASLLFDSLVCIDAFVWTGTMQDRIWIVARMKDLNSSLTELSGLHPKLLWSISMHGEDPSPEKKRRKKCNQSCTKKSPDCVSREQENIDNAINLRKLAYLEEVLKKGETLSVTMFDSFDLHEHSSELQLAPSMALLDDSALKAQERAAVSTLLGLGPLSQIDSEPVLSSLEEAEYFVKYANRSHLHNEWVKESTLMTFAKRKLTQFKRRYCDEPIDMFNKEWAKPERIISRRKCRTGPGWELLVKWFDLGYEYCTWESENARILSTPEAVLLYIDLWRRQMNAMHKKSKRALELFHQTRKQQFATYKPVLERFWVSLQVCF